MRAPETVEEVLDLTGADTPVHSASAVKNGWSRIVEGAVRHGEVIVTNHSRPEVVVVDVGVYADLVRRIQAKDPLEILRADFDHRFAALNTRAGADKLHRIAAAGIPAGTPREAIRKSGRRGSVR
ncbi:MAG: type II toxin-antitoxin system prevent-host-death family antitoxin [Rhodanobacteraceae bacterium]